jgi:large subunit ribosomal protein L4
LPPKAGIVSKLAMKKADGGSGASVELPDEIFGVEPNVAVMHQVVTAQLAAKRAGTHSTKTRAEVRGGGAKPWRQKGTGRARQGSIRAPQWRGGGVAHGPHPRDYSQRTPKKMIRLALRGALSDRAAEGKLIVVDDWGLSEPKTKSGVQLLEALGLRNVRKPEAKDGADKPKRSHGGFERNPRVLVVLFRTEQAVWKSLRNLGERVQILLPEELNTYDVLLNDWLVFSKVSLEATVARLSDGAPELHDADELDAADDSAAAPEAS